MKRTLLVLLSTIALAIIVNGQETAVLFGTVEGSDGKPIEIVNVAVVGYPYGTTTDSLGKYTLSVPVEKDVFVRFSFVGYEQKEYRMLFEPGERRELDISMNISTTELPGLEIKDKQIRNTNYIRIDPKEATFIPTSAGGIESLLITLPGVSSVNEMSSQYSVRGGNFDENLVYVNDIEIYRPFLIRAGQQEGLSFINPRLVSSVLFSAGGYDAKYGDKMSSVLDVQYKKPTEFGGSVEASFLGAQLHLEGVALKNRFTYLFGFRYKTNQYLLNALETQGEYKPNFIDIQGLITYDITPKLEVSLLGYYSKNSYKLQPETRETNFGTIQEAYRLKIFFEGQEVDNFITYTGAATFRYKLRKDLQLRLILSAFNSRESETYDVLGQYWLGLLENAPGDEQFGDVVAVQGIGSFLEHARNTMDATVINVEHKGSLEKPNHFIQWGFQYQHQIVDDKFSEWDLTDSAGYSLPYPPTPIGEPLDYPEPLVLSHSLKSNANLRTNRISAYGQDNWVIADNGNRITLSAGLRASYWDYNKELIISPRATVSLDPKWHQDFIFRFSMGLYYQPPFYRELRNLEGELNSDIKSQRSIHFVLGMDYAFQAWGRPFSFTTEAYYKKLDNLIPYVIDNVRIRYYGDNLSKGYSTGIDFKINGEFIQGIQSWAGLSIMKTAEDILDDYYYDYYNESGEKITPGVTIDNEPVDSVKVEPGYIPRPTDQRVSFSLFFQDYLPKNPTYRIYLKLIFGTGLPFGPPDSPKYKHVYRYPAYRRVDIGLSKQLIGGYSKFKKKNPLRHIDNAYIMLEVFNLFQVYNTISYIWVSDINGRQYAVPNYLTPRQLNVKLIVEF